MFYFKIHFKSLCFNSLLSSFKELHLFWHTKAHAKYLIILTLFNITFKVNVFQMY